MALQTTGAFPQLTTPRPKPKGGGNSFRDPNFGSSGQGKSMAMQTTGTFPQLTTPKPKPKGTKKGGKRG